MKLLTKEIRKELPPLDAQDGLGDKAVVYCKFFDPCGSWTWYVLEGGPVLDDQGNEIDYHFFGLVDGHEKELGYFSLKELESVKGPLGIGIERDLYFGKKTIGEVKGL